MLSRGDHLDSLELGDKEFEFVVLSCWCPLCTSKFVPFSRETRRREILFVPLCQLLLFLSILCSLSSGAWPQGTRRMASLYQCRVMSFDCRHEHKHREREQDLVSFSNCVKGFSFSPSGVWRQATRLFVTSCQYLVFFSYQLVCIMMRSMATTDTKGEKDYLCQFLLCCR